MDNERSCDTGQPRAIGLVNSNTVFLSQVCDKSFISPFIDEITLSAYLALQDKAKNQISTKINNIFPRLLNSQPCQVLSQH